jgi:replication factor C subunit 3/5
MFFIDKYSKYIDNIYDNMKINNIINMFNKDIMNIILYGQDKDHITFIKNNIINKLYKSENISIKDVEYEINNFNNIKNYVMIKQSRYHIIIKPKNNGLDKYIIQNVISKFISYKSISLEKNNNIKKIIIIELIDNLCLYSQSSLRRTIEKFSNDCRFIFICNNLAKIIEPLLSRCVLIKTEILEKSKILDVVNKICDDEKINISEEIKDNLIIDHNYNLKQIICSLELYKNKYDTKLNWINILDRFAKELYSMKKLDMKFIQNIKSCFYILYVSNINIVDIMKNLMSSLLNLEKDPNKKYKLIELTNEYEMRLNIGTRKIIHFETYIYNILRLIHMDKFKINKFNFFN